MKVMQAFKNTVNTLKGTLLIVVLEILISQYPSYFEYKKDYLIIID